MEPVTDELLLERARRGDRDALGHFACRWWPIVGRIAWGMLGDARQAAAVTEEVVETAVDSAGTSRVRCWMYRMAVWLAIVRRRSRPPRPASTPIFTALEHLYCLDRAAFLLRDVERLSLAETAAALELPVDDIQARTHRARLALGSLLIGPHSLEVPARRLP